METITVKGVRIPALGFGTWALRGREAERSVSHALECGYRHIDTAAAYDNEERVGAAIAASRVERGAIFLVSKVWHSDLAAAAVRRSAEASLRRLRTDYLDLLLVHWPNPAVPLAETLEAFLALKRDGKVRQIGVSNFTVRLLQEATAIAGEALLANQVEYHPFLSQRPVHRFLVEHDMMLTAYCPLARGRVAEDPVIRAVAAKHSRTPAQVTLRWLLDQDRVAAIPKAASDTHRLANLAVFDFALDDEDRRRIDALRGSYRIANDSISPDWDAA